MKKNENIVLIGMSGAGKSTLGVLLAKALGKSFVDTDILIQQSEDRLLQQIIDEDGTSRFMEIEEKVVSAMTVENSVIATGGSVVYSEKAMEALRKNGVCLYLRVGFSELSERISNITTRGIVFKNASSLHEVYLERQPLYEQYAHVTVNCTGRTIEESVNEIITALTEGK